VAKRKIFDELMEGVNAMRKHREEKLTPRRKRVNNPTRETERRAPVSYKFKGRT